MDQNNNPVANGMCSGTPPPTSQSCNQSACKGWWYANSSSSAHQGGNANGNSWEIAATGIPLFLTYGPYVTGIAAGSLKAVFTLTLDNTTADNLPVVDLDVFRLSTNTVFASTTVTRQQFNAPFQVQTFELPFTYDGQGALEFRVYVRGVSYVRHAITQVIQN